jgi:type 1 glutamine amidotransferase
LLALASAFVLSGGAVSAEEQAAIKVLHVTGGGHHDYDGQTKIINETLEAAIPGIKITVAAVESSRDAPEVHPVFEKEDWHKGFDVVIYNMCNSANTNNPELVERIVAPHREGLGAVAIHCTMQCFRPDETGKWNDFLGIESRNHEGHAPVKVTFADIDHPILNGLPDTWSYEKGELYRVISEGDRVVPLAVGISGEEKEHTVVWTNTYGEGRVFGTTIGHYNETMLEEEFQVMLKNGVLWAAGKLEKKSEE